MRNCFMCWLFGRSVHWVAKIIKSFTCNCSGVNINFSICVIVSQCFVYFWLLTAFVKEFSVWYKICLSFLDLSDVEVLWAFKIHLTSFLLKLHNRVSHSISRRIRSVSFTYWTPPQCVPTYVLHTTLYICQSALLVYTS